MPHANSIIHSSVDRRRGGRLVRRLAAQRGRGHRHAAHPAAGVVGCPSEWPAASSWVGWRAWRSGPSRARRASPGVGQRCGGDAERGGRGAAVRVRHLGRHRARVASDAGTVGFGLAVAALRGQVVLVRDVLRLPGRQRRYVCWHWLASPASWLIFCCASSDAALRDRLGERGLVVGRELAGLERRLAVSRLDRFMPARLWLVPWKMATSRPVDADVVLALVVPPEPVRRRRRAAARAAPARPSRSASGACPAAVVVVAIVVVAVTAAAMAAAPPAAAARRARTRRLRSKAAEALGPVEAAVS